MARSAVSRLSSYFLHALGGSPSQLLEGERQLPRIPHPLGLSPQLEREGGMRLMEDSFPSLVSGLLSSPRLSSYFLHAPPFRHF